MSRGLLRIVGASLSGLLFGAGLLFSGMTDPRRVLAFLDLRGAWDPSLLGVMGGAVVTYAIGFRVLRRRERSLTGERLAIPSGQRIDAKLLGGSALFGVGWGLSGYCPGPALVALGSAGLGVVVFVAAWALGSYAALRASAELDRDAGALDQRSAKARSTV
ncbi:MAG: YeeE/YedE family protein [Polyangiaceae bacterium]